MNAPSKRQKLFTLIFFALVFLTSPVARGQGTLVTWPLTAHPGPSPAPASINASDCFLGSGLYYSTTPYAYGGMTFKGFGTPELDPDGYIQFEAWPKPDTRLKITKITAYCNADMAIMEIYCSKSIEFSDPFFLGRNGKVTSIPALFSIPALNIEATDGEKLYFRAYAFGGYTDNNAFQIKDITLEGTVSVLIDCTITDASGPLCPSSSHAFSGPAGMTGYFWEISGNGTITGGANASTVTVEAGATCGESFILSLSVEDGSANTNTCSREFTVESPAPVVLNVPGNHSTAPCLTQEEIQLEFTGWLAQAGVDGGCNAVLATSPPTGELSPPDEWGQSTTVTWTATSDCEGDVVKSATFTVPEAPVAGINNEYFRTHSGPGYKGIDVGFSLSGIPPDEIEGITVELKNALDQTIAVNAAGPEIVEEPGGTCNSPFIVMKGSYIEQKWDFVDDYQLVVDNKPVKAQIKITALTGYVYEATNTVLNETDLSWEELFELPTADLGGTRSVCAGGSAEFQVHLTGQPPWTFTWNDGMTDHHEMAYSTPYSITANPTDNTTCYLKGLVTDGYGYTNAATGEARIYFGPVTSLPETHACINTPIDIPVVVRKFKEVRDISLTLKYDSSVLTYMGFENGDLSFGEEEIVAIYVNDRPYDGDFHVLRISETSDKTLPPLDDDAVLLWLKFNYNGGITDLEWIDSPDDSWCSYSFLSALDETGFETETFCDTPAEAHYISGLVSPYPEPDVRIAFNDREAASGDAFTYCYSDNVEITLLQVSGAAPYQVEWTMDGVSYVASLSHGDVLFSGKLSAGIHDVQLTSATDANGCELRGILGYGATALVNEEPDAFLTIDGNNLLPHDVVTYCADVTTIPLALASLRDGQEANGTAPFTLSFSINGEPAASFSGLDYGPIANLPEYFPKDLHGRPLPGDYTIAVTSFSDANGCPLGQEALNNNTFTLKINPQPDVFFTIDEEPLLPQAVHTYCPDVEAIRLVLVNEQEEAQAVGIPPFDLKFTVNDGEKISLASVDYNVVMNLVQHLPEGILPGLIAAGDYVIRVTELNDANGCPSRPDALEKSTFTLRINPYPLAAVIPADASCFGTANGSVTMEPADGTPSYRYTLEPGGYASGEQSGAFTFDGLAAGTYTWTMTDVLTSCVSSGSVRVDEPFALTLTGTVRYYNQAGTPLGDVNVTLREPDTGTFVAATTTGNEGEYSFEGICPGIYTVEISTGLPARSINSTDAGQVNAWNVAQIGTEWPPVEKVRFLAGDVDGDLYVNAGDAGIIQDYFLSLGTDVAFEKPWEFWSAHAVISTQPQPDDPLQVEVTTESPEVIRDFYGLISGDFNRSNLPSAAPMNSLLLKSAVTGVGSVTLLKGEELAAEDAIAELPIRAASAMKVGAISLILYFPADQLEVTGVCLKDDFDQAAGYNVMGDLLVIGWNSVSPLTVDAGEPLVTVRLKVTGESKGMPLFFELAANPLNELADENMVPIENASLIMDGLMLTGELTGAAEPLRPESLQVTCFPNPFSGQVILGYTLPEAGYVDIDLAGISGNRIKILSHQQKPSGDHQVRFDGRNLTPGVYTVVVRFTGQTKKPQVTTARLVKQ